MSDPVASAIEPESGRVVHETADAWNVPAPAVAP
jgi:hypothetical protein